MSIDKTANRVASKQTLVLLQCLWCLKRVSLVESRTVVALFPNFL